MDNVLYMQIGESGYSATDASLNSNDFHICAGEQTTGTFGSMDLVTMADRLGEFDIPNESDVFRPPAPFTPFDCTELSGGAIGEITLTVE